VVKEGSLKRTGRALLEGVIACHAALADDCEGSEAFERALATVLAVTGGELGYCSEILDDEDGCSVHELASSGRGGAEPGLLEATANQALATMRPAVSRTESKDRWALGLPLFHNHQLRGVLAAAGSRGNPEELLDQLSPLARACGDAIEMRRVLEAQARRANQLEQALVKTRAEHQTRLAVLSHIEVGILGLDDQRSVNWATGMHRFTELDDDQLLGQPWATRFENNPRLVSQVAAALAGSNASDRIFARIALPSGAELMVEIDVRSHDRVLCFYDRGYVGRAPTHDGPVTQENILGQSPAIVTLLEQIADVARGDWNVLIEGETGVGKELVARSIHTASGRRHGPYVAINCGALTDSLLASQLFGHRRGAFTGAVSDQEGLFESARGGTLFLDEIGDVSPKLQAALLRAIQEKEIRRVGDTRSREVDVRILAASHEDLTQADGFRPDLLYRIRTGRILVPPLRERLEDVRLLAESFLESAKRSSGRPELSFSKQALNALSSYHWPGNVRELRAAVEFCVIYSHSDSITVADLPPEIREHHPDTPPPFRADKAELMAALRKAEGNRTRAAQILGIGRATLYRRMHAMNIGVRK
jgi:transcriptional regulator with PAS, ATPase and Fis domain